MRVNLLSDKNKAAMEGISLESTQVLMGLIEDKAAMEKLLLERRFREVCARFRRSTQVHEGNAGLNGKRARNSPCQEPGRYAESAEERQADIQ